ncbi:MAG: hypothetical protein ACYTEQ_09310 [Planctomycetota bacterium]|jgi:hypothetical protein
MQQKTAKDKTPSGLESPSSVAAKQLLHTFFNPIAKTEDVITIGDTGLKKELSRATALFIGWGALGLGARSLINTANRGKDKKHREKVKAYLNARYPILSEDPYTSDTALEEASRETGLRKLAELTTAEQQAEIDDIRSSLPGGGQGEPPVWMNYRPALGVAALMAGAYAGWRIADRMGDVQEKTTVDESIKQRRNELDQLVYSEYMRTRGAGDLDKEGSGIGDFLRKTTKITSGVYLVWAAASFAIMYAASRRWMNENDPARQRMKQLEQESRRLAKIEQPPVLLSETALPELPGGVAAKRPEKKESVKLPGQAGGASPLPLIDQADPYGSLLGR